MRFSVVFAATAALTVAHAQYDTFFFATNASRWQCPGLPYDCKPPFACSHDATVDKYYCCIPGSSSNVCWTGSPACTGNGTGVAGIGQTDCGSFCCLNNREQCTQRQGQINICWATAQNPLSDVTDVRMNQTFSSLSAASPSSTRLSFLLAQVTSVAQSTSGSVSATTTRSSSASTSSGTAAGSTSSPSSGSSSSSSKGISGGAIAGIVVGVIGGVVLVLGVLFFVWRSRRKQRTATPSQEPYRPTGMSYQEKQEHPDASMPRPHAAEMDAASQAQYRAQEYYTPREADSKPVGHQNRHQYAQELPTSNT